MQRVLPIILSVLTAAGLALAVAYVADSHGDHVRGRLGVESGSGLAFQPYTGGSGSAAPPTAAAPGSGDAAPARAEGGAPSRAPAPQPSAEPASQPPRVSRGGAPPVPGPTVGGDPTRADAPVTIQSMGHRPAAPPVAGSGDGPDDGADPEGASAAPTEAELFFDRVDTAWRHAAASLTDCAAGLPTTTRDSIYVEMTVSDSADTRGVGTPRIVTFQSNALAGDREICARQALTEQTFPAPWEAVSGEGPSYTVLSDTRVEYTVEFEFEVGAE